MEVHKEKGMTGNPNVISYRCTKKILEQMDKNICKIKINNNQGTGFFCKIPFPNLNNMMHDVLERTRIDMTEDEIRKFIAKKIRNLDTKQPHHSKKIYRNFRFRFNLPTFEKMKMGLWKKAKCQKDIQNFINFSEN